MSDDRDRVTAILTLREKTTPGVWKLWGMTVMADQDGTSNVDSAVEVAHTYMTVDGHPRTFDADFICTAHREVPEILGRLLEALDTIYRLEGENANLRDRLEDATVSDILARNPGMDVAELRQFRRERGLALNGGIVSGEGSQQ